MINVSFSDSLSGMLHMSEYYAKEENSEIQNMGENVFTLLLSLELGDISENPFGKKREKAFLNMYGLKEIPFRRGWFEESIKKIAEIERLVKAGHEIRIWYSERSDEMCAFCWLLSMLDSWEIQNERILYVKLPMSILYSDGEYEVFYGSGGFRPLLLVDLVFRQRRLTEKYKAYHIEQWKRAQEENAEMRVSMNSQIISVDAGFFDSVILAEINKMEETFREATLIGKTLQKLSETDSFLAWRIETMIEAGKLEIVEESQAGERYYRRLLKKTKKFV